MGILVSINCITYNHKDTISDAIEGFLMQNTSFNYEILVGEDCSSDNTREIVKKYVEKYPDKIRLITSDTNVGAWENSRRIFESSNGKYIAICEGDDFWVDQYKLEKQVKYMEENNDCTFCFHNAEFILADGRKTNKKMVTNTNNQNIFNAGEISLLRSVPTASFFFRKSSLQNPPDWYYNSIVGDLPLLLIATSKGYAYYINEVMSYYRVGQLHSAAGKLLGKANSEKIKFTNGVINILRQFDEYTGGEYEENLEKSINREEFNVLVLKNKLKDLKSEKYIAQYNSLAIIGKTKIMFRYYFPFIYSCATKIKYFIRYILPTK